jgi:hypothetical protein
MVMREEYKSLIKNGVGNWLTGQVIKMVVKYKWVYKAKKKCLRDFEKFKARLVA